ncbi:8023_t:CDS:2, partial [Racocetra fulgida]
MANNDTILTHSQNTNSQNTNSQNTNSQNTNSQNTNSQNSNSQNTNSQNTNSQNNSNSQNNNSQNTQLSVHQNNDVITNTPQPSVPKNNVSTINICDFCMKSNFSNQIKHQINICDPCVRSNFSNQAISVSQINNNQIISHQVTNIPVPQNSASNQDIIATQHNSNSTTNNLGVSLNKNDSMIMQLTQNSEFENCPE